jgi:uncharacterized protein
MSDRDFRLLERYQKVDEALRLALQHRSASPFEILRLKMARLAIKSRLARLERSAGKSAAAR